MRLDFCDHHIVLILKNYFASKQPLDLLLSKYFKLHKSIGSKDRKKIGETLYTIFRFKSLIEFLSRSQKPIDLLSCYQQISFEKIFQDPKIPEYARFGMSPFLYEKFIEIFGKEKGQKICQILNTQAPTTIRVNTIKTDREKLFEAFKNLFEMSFCQLAENGIQFKKREPLFSLPEFKQGFFEVQDEGSQLIAGAMEIKPKEHVLDFCSGSGGKTLAFAHKMEGKGQIYLNDNRSWVLQEARKRLKRAGVQNVQFNLPKKPVDWVLTDVPCSGSGTLRRNPDAKWKIDAEMIQRLILEQREIVKEALQYLKNDGYLVYATCSIFPEENDTQVEYFLNHFPLKLQSIKTFLPIENGMDGFFVAVFKKQSLV